jgi:AmiR/NasT family two-component response regulator
MEMKGLRVLVAEDEPLVASVIARELVAIRAVVVGLAADGRQAVDMTVELKPDVVLMDIEMPELNGVEAVGEIQAVQPTPVVMLTVYSGQEKVAGAAAAGAGAYVVKPPRACELERAIMIARARFADLMELRHLTMELQAALAHVKRLQGLLPICMYCHKIRNERAVWDNLERYVMEHSEAKFSHSICPACMKVHHPEVESTPEGHPLR